MSSNTPTNKPPATMEPPPHIDLPKTKPKDLPDAPQSAPLPGKSTGPLGDSAEDPVRPPLNSTQSEPPATEASLKSPERQHRRQPSFHRQVKETLDAHVEYTSDEADGRTYHQVNQYTIVEEIGRGSYGAVHLATDQFDNEYAIKEFSKARLRKRAQSRILRQGPRGPGRRPIRSKSGGDPLTPQQGGERPGEKNDALYLIREEVAIMKKLHHPNLVNLIEVLDDPEEDSLYMVLEMCKKGVVMKVGLEENADPYSDENCRYLFRDLLLGIEYLHAQGIIHRDIKPDNLLVSQDDVLKVVDFGVSEMFEKKDEMMIAKSAGSPAFLPPELCGKHGEVSGQAVDIWSMGITLFCLRYGKIPFNRSSVMEMYEAIKDDELKLPADEDPVFVDLMKKILDKDPETRITMDELREHPWVTKDGTDMLLSAEENCAHQIEPVNDLDIERAFTRKMDNLFSVIKAIHKFKSLLPSKLSATSTPTSEADMPPLDEAGAKEAKNAEKAKEDSKNDQKDEEGTKKDDDFDPAEEKARAVEIEALLEARRKRTLHRDDEDPGKGQATEVGESEPMVLGLGTGVHDKDARDENKPDIVADSPTAVDFNIYDRAYEEAINKRLEENPAERPVMYLTKYVKETDYFHKFLNIVEGAKFSSDSIVEQMRDTSEQLYSRFTTPATTSKLSDLVGRLGLSDPVKEVPEAAIDPKALKEKVLELKEDIAEEGAGKST